MAVTEAGAPVLATTAATAQIVDAALFTIATTSSTAVTAGSSQTITVASGTALSNPMWLTIDAGAATETVLAAISGTSVTAFFTNAHSGTYNVVANLNRQIESIGSPSVRTQIAEVDANNRLNTITPDIVVTGQTLSSSATTNSNVISNVIGLRTLVLDILTIFGSLIIEGSIDNVNWFSLPFFQLGSGSWNAAGSINSTGVYFWPISGFPIFRIRCSVTGASPSTYTYNLSSTNIASVYGPQTGSVILGIGTAGIPSTITDGTGPLSVLPTLNYVKAWNGTNWDRIRKDSYANGPQWMTSGGGTLAAVAAAAGTTAIKASAGRLCRVLVTTLGTAQLTFFNNASAASGTIIGIVPASVLAGTLINVDMPASLGITGDFLTNSPAVTVAFW
jgi:hypothetical protein